MDVGCYCVHLFRMIISREPERVFAESYGREVDLGLRCVLYFGNDLFSIFESSVAEYERHLVIIRGEKGKIELKNPRVPSGTAEVIIRTVDKQERKIFPFIDTYRLQIEDFSKRLMRGRDDPVRKEMYDPYHNYEGYRCTEEVT